MLILWAPARSPSMMSQSPPPFQMSSAFSLLLVPEPQPCIHSRIRSIKWCEERLGHETRSRVQEQLHLRNLLVHLFHKLNDKVHQLVLQHLLGVEVRDQETDIVALDRLSPQNIKALRTLCQEARELVDKDVLNLVGLLDLDAYSHTVDRRLDVHSFVLVTGHGKRV
jgi:hypothetical protein